VRKICIVITARPSYSRVKSALQAIQHHPDLQLQLVAAASAVLDRYGNVADQIEKDGFQLDARVSMVIEGENAASMAKTTGLGIIELASVFDNLKPDVVLSIADRYETLATAIAATFMGIPLVHLQGGEITGSIDERVRHAVTKLADLHLTASTTAARRVIRMGEDPSTVFSTGCPSIDLVAHALADPQGPTLSIDDLGGVGADVDLSEPFVIVMLHPVTSEVEKARHQVETVLRAVVNASLPALWFWPNVDAGSDGTSRGIRHFREMNSTSPIRFIKHLPSEDFIRLLARSSAIIGNSSVAIRECAFIGVPAVNIGSRQSGRDRGQNVIDVEFNVDEIVDAIRTQTQSPAPRSEHLYGEGDAGERIAQVVAQHQFTRQKRLVFQKEG